MGVCGALLVALLSGIPVAFAFLLIDIIGMYLFMGGTAGLANFVTTLRSSVSIFTLIPIPLFILMGEVLFRSGVAARILRVFDVWLSGLPGRLSVVTIATATLFAALSGSSPASTAMMGSLMAPEMLKRGYNPRMIVGPIVSGGMLAVIIPPSILVVLYGGLCGTPVGKLLIAGIVPGLLLSVSFIVYNMVASLINPSLTPKVETPPLSISKKLAEVYRSFLPAAIIIFLVLGTIFSGVCTPTEASALGAAGCFILAACYGRLNWTLVKDCVSNTTRATVMIFFIVTASTGFSQLLAFTGVTRDLMGVAVGFPVPPTVTLIAMLIVMLILGCLIDQISMIMISVPIFFPVSQALKFDPIWFGVVFLLSIELGLITPPFGMNLFVAKGVVPQSITMNDIYSGANPYVMLGALIMGVLIAFPVLVTWLPGFM